MWASDYEHLLCQVAVSDPVVDPDAVESEEGFIFDCKDVEGNEGGAKYESNEDEGDELDNNDCLDFDD